MFKKLSKILKDLLFPIECLSCGQEDFWLCQNCFNKIKTYDKIFPFTEPIKYLNGVISACPYNQTLLKNLIHAFKFNYLEDLAQPLAKILIEFWENNSVRARQKNVRARRGAPQQIINPIIIPVPLNKKRLLERGFNQAELIAKIFAEHFNYPLLTTAMIRQKNTSHQVGLNKSQRQNNIKNCFQVIKPETVYGQKIILIDDVVTTGSTLDEAAKALKQKGAVEVWGLTLAKD